MLRAGLGKVIVRREGTESEGIVWGAMENIGPQTKSGMTFGQGFVAYSAKKAEVVEKGEGYVLEVVSEEDILAYRRETDKEASIEMGPVKRKEEPEGMIEAVMEGVKDANKES